MRGRPVKLPYILIAPHAKHCAAKTRRMEMHSDPVRLLNWNSVGQRKDGNPYRKHGKEAQFLILHCSCLFCEARLAIPMEFVRLQLYLERAGEIT